MSRVSAFTVAVVLGLGARAHAADPSADDIMKGVEFRDQGKDLSASVTIRVQPAKGSARTREFKFFRKTFPDQTRYAVFFVSPAELRNAAFMEWDKRGAPDERWLYLPGIAQVRRMATGDERLSFFGSDFAYEDMTNRDPDGDTHKLVGSEKVKEWDCWVVESTPKSTRGVEFAKLKTWVWKQANLVVKQEYFDRSGKVIKRGTLDAAQQVQGKWIWQKGTMTDLKSGSKSELTIADAKIDTGVPEHFFTERQMQKGLP